MDNLAIFLDHQQEKQTSRYLDKNDNSIILAVRKQYEQAMQTMQLRLAVLAYNFAEQQNYQPIYSLQYRLKSVESIINKLSTKNAAINAENIRYNVLDIIGFRIVTHYQQDIYPLLEQILKMKDVKLVKIRDYIEFPKRNGYRSLHLVILLSIPGCETKFPLEIQFRTVAMDMWASIEHKLCYKTDGKPDTLMRSMLAKCANELAIIDEQITDISNLSQDQQTNSQLTIYNKTRKR